MTTPISLSRLQYSVGDIFVEDSFSGANNQSSAANITDLVFSNGNTRAFKAWVTVIVDATTDLFAIYELEGIQRGSSWSMSSSYTGDNTSIVFSITSSGQVQYTSPSYEGFVSLTMKFRAITVNI